MNARPRSIFGLLWHLSWLRRRVVFPSVALVLVLGFSATRACPGPAAPVRVATFNIRFFPESPRQIEGAFAMIAELDVPIIAVQEITDPRVFSDAAEQKLGPYWRTEFGPGGEHGDRLRPGVLYDSKRYQLDYTRRYHHTTIDGIGQPMLEVRLFPRDDGPTVRVFVVHLKAGGKDRDHEMRRKQLEAITPILRRAAAGRDEVVILGDFNATGEADREALQTFARETKLHWASEELGCTAYWTPPKTQKCSSSALDHVFTSRPASETTARGPCQSVGCEPGASCPIFHKDVSDHCPVTSTF